MPDIARIWGVACDVNRGQGGRIRLLHALLKHTIV